MCFDATSSGVAATLGILSGVVAFGIAQPILGGFIVWYSLMQVAEFCIWRGLETNSVGLNQRGTNLGESSLKLHALVAIALIFVFKAESLEKQRPKRIALQVILVCAVLLWVSDSLVPASRTTKPTCPSGCRLDWAFANPSYFVQVLLICVAIYIGAPELFWPVLLFYGGVIFLSMVFAAFSSKTTFKSAVSTLWCFGAAVFAPVLVGCLWWWRRGKMGRSSPSFPRGGGVP